MLPRVALPQRSQVLIFHNYVFQKQHCIETWIIFSSAKKVAKTSMKQVYQLKVAVTLTAHQVTEVMTILIYLYQRSSPKNKDTIKKAKKTLLAKVKRRVSTSLILPLYPYSDCEPGQSQDGVQRPK